MIRLLPVFFAALVITSCATSKSDTTGTSEGAMTEAEDTSPVVTPAQVPWKDMTGQQRGRYMAKVVVPEFRKVFQAYDPKEFEKVNCATCHGKHGKENKFKMPSPELPVLPSSEEEFMATTYKEHPEMVKFMGEQVTPKMAELLGVPHFDPQHPDPNAFSCQGCHTLKGAEAKQ